MIKVNIIKKEHIQSIEVTGHAGYDEYGKDIVCASVSCIITTTVNAIERLCEGSISYTEKDGYILINVLKHNDTVDKLLDNLLDLLNQLQQQYPNNITIK